MGMIIMNGKEYASSPKDGFPPIIYSDEEREIGVWRDGKPLYQKTVVLGALPSSKTAKSYTLDIENIDKIFILNTFAENSGVSFPGNTYRPENDGNGGFGCWLSVDNGNHIINFATDRDRSSYTGIVTICYTKTTDVPGSGKYTTYGGLAHHYSETEQVVGTWIDGKPVYERAVKFSPDIMVYSANWVSLFQLSTYSADKIIDLALYNGDYTKPLSSFMSDLQDGYLKVFVYTNWSVRCMILRYTKTTD